MNGDTELAARLAEQAGALLSALCAGARNADPAELRRRGDAESNTFLLRELAATRPDDAVLSEESPDDPARLRSDRVWIVDPLDGTREFAIPGRADWAVHIALWQRGAGITDAAVAQPALGLLHTTDDPAGADPAPRSRPVILVSASQPPGFARAVAADLGAELRPMGSAGSKAMAVVRGLADAYLHAGGQWEWDSAAPAGVALAAGLHASRGDGTPLVYNRVNPYLPDLVICRPDLAGPLLAAIAEHA